MTSNNQSIAIIGANGQVGMELSILLREAGYTVYPVIRNKISAAMFESHGFNCRVGEITDQEAAPRLLADVDAVIVAAFAPWFRGPKPRPARQINEAIVRNSITYAPAHATVVYFSSIVAFGSDIGLSDLHWYGRTKRHLESIVKNECRGTDHEWYNLRLGLIYGPNQEFTNHFVDELQERQRVYLPVRPDRQTNVAHTVTLAETISQCVQQEPDPGTYGVVNQPQWTWSDLVEYYLPETNVQYRPELATDETNAVVPQFKSLLGNVLPAVDTYREILLSLLLYLPDWASTYVLHAHTDSETAAAIGEYQDRVAYEHRHLSYDPVPEPHIEVPAAEELIAREEAVYEALNIPSHT
ncbi:NAD-dependent epimerase/dehydratase family protein [Halohasta salina]|uniref:NAD-dependent epimerase/dehydratase family protein n=1 Tax=Halohasta salina TaxID=2961621 RepID=UPI0021133308|nr:NAD(P)-dependent oxidoreductase [Halohasta salina]